MREAKSGEQPTAAAQSDELCDRDRNRYSKAFAPAYYYALKRALTPQSFTALLPD